MPKYDRRFESQDQPKTPQTSRFSDNHRPHHGPDYFALNEPVRDQPRNNQANWWNRLWTAFGIRTRT